LFVDFQFPDDFLRVATSDFFVFVFIFSSSKYTDDFPYFAALVTAIFEYMLFSTLLVRLVTGMTCGLLNPLALAIMGMNYLLFIAGTSFNVSRAIWAIWVINRDTTTTRDLFPGQLSALDTCWYCIGGVVAMCLLYSGYSQSRRARGYYNQLPVMLTQPTGMHF
jgi:hypothetical protein